MPLRSLSLPILRFLSRLGPIAFVGLAFVLAGCGTSRVVSTDSAGRIVPIQGDAAELEARLRAEVRTWEGTPHRWGGETRSGADCSGFVMRVYDDVLGVKLPRTTEDQAGTGREVSNRSLSAGDLIFFRTAPKTRHVGIYLSEGEFAHASTSEGVRISKLDADYWQRTYWMSRRIVDHVPAIATRAPEADSPTPPASVLAEDQEHSSDASRVGW